MSYLLRKNLHGISADSIEKFLLLTGWEYERDLKNTHLRIFTNKDDRAFKIAVPTKEDAKDYYERVYDLVRMLSVYSDSSEGKIIDSLKSAFTDRLQFRIITETSKNGKIPLDYAARCLDGLKDLVLYAACAEENARPICARTCNMAKNQLEKFEFEQTEVGSFIFNVGVLVASAENEQLYLEEIAPPPDEPPAHKIVKRIETAIQQVNRVVNREISIAALVENAFVDGITANMCDALSKIKPSEGEDITLETSVYYAEAITREVAPPKKCTLDNVHFAFVEEISKRYKDCTLVEDVRLSGTIKMLSKNAISSEEAENKIRLLTKFDNQIRAVDLILSPANHAKACDAYRDDKEVTVTGTIDKSSKHWFFSEVTDFRVEE